MISNAVELMVPILLAALGGLLTERAGVLNIGLEGLLLFGAFCAAAVAVATGSPVAGLAAGAAGGVALAWLYSIACIELSSNIFIAGLATNLFAAGIVPYLSSLLFGTKGVLRIGAAGLPKVLGYSPMVYVALAAAALLTALLFLHPYGIRLRAAGDGPQALEARGINPRRYQRSAMLLSGLFAGLGGAEVAIRLGVYLPNISAGRGWIALVAIYLGLRHPLGVVIAAAVFALFESFAGAAQGFTSIPGTLLLGLPYLITLAAMVVYSAVARSGKTRVE